jgi:Zn-dependent protease
MWKLGLGFAFLSSLFGFVFAAPGAVIISQTIDLWGSPVSITKKSMGIISIMGPVVNLAIGGIFYALNAWFPSQLFEMGVYINIWLAIFNMIPIPPLDGSKVLAWDKRIWLVFFALLIAVFALTIGV